MDDDIQETNETFDFHEVVTDKENLTEHPPKLDHDEPEEITDGWEPDIVELTFQDFDLTTRENILHKRDAHKTLQKAEDDIVNRDAHGYEQERDSQLIESHVGQDDNSDGIVINVVQPFSENVYIPDKGHINQISGMALVTDANDIMICDYDNRMIRLMNCHCKAMDHYRSIFQPWDIVFVDPTLFIVSFPFVRMLQYFKIMNSKSIAPWYPLISGNEYYGIAYERGHVIATCLYDSKNEMPCVHVIDRKGNIQNVINKDSDGNQLFVEPKHITVNDRNRAIYVLDQGNQSIVSFTREGEILSIMRNVCGDPISIAIDSIRGTVIVSDRCTHSIVLMDESCKVYRIVKAKNDTSWSPTASLYDSTLGRLLVAIENSPVIREFEI